MSKRKRGEKMDTKDKILVCQNCGSKFYFTVGEQKFYKEKGLNIPKYCKNCREQKKKNRGYDGNNSKYCPKACSTCYFQREILNQWGILDHYICARDNVKIVNDKPCKFWTKDIGL